MGYLVPKLDSFLNAWLFLVLCSLAVEYTDCTSAAG